MCTFRFVQDRCKAVAEQVVKVLQYLTYPQHLPELATCPGVLYVSTEFRCWASRQGAAVPYLSTHIICKTLLLTQVDLTVRLKAVAKPVAMVTQDPNSTAAPSQTCFLPRCTSRFDWKQLPNKSPRWSRIPATRSTCKNFSTPSMSVRYVGWRHYIMSSGWISWHEAACWGFLHFFNTRNVKFMTVWACVFEHCQLYWDCIWLML